MLDTHRIRILLDDVCLLSGSVGISDLILCKTLVKIVMLPVLFNRRALYWRQIQQRDTDHIPQDSLQAGIDSQIHTSVIKQKTQGK